MGPILAAVFVSKIGDVTRFPSPAHLASWAGMTPTHHESDTKVRRGKISKQGSRHVRWAAVEAVSKNHGDGKIKADYRRIAERRGRNIGWVAAGASPKQIATWAGHTSVSVARPVWPPLPRARGGRSRSARQPRHDPAGNRHDSRSTGTPAGRPRDAAGFRGGHAKHGSPEAPVMWPEQHFYRGRWGFRTLDLCRVKAALSR